MNRSSIMNTNLFICIKVFRNEFMQNDYTPQDYVLALVESGSFSANGQTVGENEAFLFEKGKRYRRYVETPLTMYLFRFDCQNCTIAEGKLKFKDTQRIQSTIKLLDAIHTDSVSEHFSYSVSLFNDIITQYGVEHYIYLKEKELSDKLIAAAAKYMQENIRKITALSDIADKYNLSYVQFSRRFKTALGVTPVEYMKNIKIKKAKQLLFDTGISIKRVAYECGFNNEYYFSNFFKKNCNISPSNYRKISKNIPNL